MFTQMGVFRLKPEDVDRDEMELELIDFGLEDISEATDDDGNPLLHFYCGATEFGTLQSKLEELKSPIVSSGFEWVPSTTTELDDEKLEDVLKLIGKLEEDDDVQAIFPQYWLSSCVVTRINRVLQNFGRTLKIREPVGADSAGEHTVDALTRRKPHRCHVRKRHRLQALQL